MNSPSNPGTSGAVLFISELIYSFGNIRSGKFPPFLELTHFALGLNRGHELTGLHHLTRSTIVVIYCNNFQYDQGVKWLLFCHGSHGYSQTEVPAFKLCLLHIVNSCSTVGLDVQLTLLLHLCLGIMFGLLTIAKLVR